MKEEKKFLKHIVEVTKNKRKDTLKCPKSKLFYFYSEMNDFIEIVKEKELEFYNPETIFIFLKIFIL
ncbi:hypothetical protein U3516DRAFT_779285 [Neocallimastix sp. 'constans']